MDRLQQLVRTLRAQRKPSLRLMFHFLASGMLAVGFWQLSKRGSALSSTGAIVLMSIFYFRSFGLMHDASHNTAHPRAGINHTVGILLGALCFLPYWPWKKLHIEHHQWTGNIDKDPVMKLLRVYPTLPPRKQRFLNFNWRNWLPYMAFLQHVVFWVESWRRLSFKQSRTDAFYNGASVLLAVAIYCLVLAQASPAIALNALLGFVFYLVWVEIINFPHHLDIPQQSGDTKTPFSQQYQFARSCHYPKWFAHHALNNFNYHVEHHMFPHVPWYELAALRPLVKEHLGEKYNESHGSEWIRHNKKRDLQDVLNYRAIPKKERAA